MKKKSSIQVFGEIFVSFRTRFVLWCYSAAFKSKQNFKTKEKYPINVYRLIHNF